MVSTIARRRIGIRQRLGGIIKVS